MLLLVCAGATALYAVVLVYQADRELVALRNDLERTRGELSTLRTTADAGIVDLTAKHTALSDLLYGEQKRIDELTGEVQGFDRTVGRLSGSVKTLEKLTTTDPELLQKYSKIYFLNEHYKPADLTVIEETFDLVNGKEVAVHSDVWPYLKDLLESAREDDVDIMVLSGYRSFEEQSTLKKSYTQQYGTGANTFSADQGYSEHQLGTTVDFTNTTIGENIGDFEETKAFTWLVGNAHKYGFVMSYPKDNAFYVYEPWHWRFVGEDLARDLKKEGKYFYDLEQREIDTYIPTLFD